MNLDVNSWSKSKYRKRVAKINYGEGAKTNHEGGIRIIERDSLGIILPKFFK
jgi:hypothetical protein